MKPSILPDSQIKYPKPPTKVPAGMPERTPEVQERLDFFHKNVGKEFVATLNRSARKNNP